MNPNDTEELKRLVKEKYGKIAEEPKEDSGCCCGCGPKTTYTVFSEDYTSQEGYVADADLNLGCGLPTNYANISKGDTVLDLGSGAGNDAFVARAIVGDSGHIIGVDMTEKMVEKAASNTKVLGYTNVEFRLGDIENLPIENDSVDVVVSNCVLNLVPDKSAAFAEMYRVLKPGAHFCVSDMVTKGTIPDSLRKEAELYAGCVAGAIEQDDYLTLLKKVGFEEISVVKSRLIQLPDELLSDHLTAEEIAEYRNSINALVSATVYGIKPA